MIRIARLGCSDATDLNAEKMLSDLLEGKKIGRLNVYYHTVTADSIDVAIASLLKAWIDQVQGRSCSLGRMSLSNLIVFVARVATAAV